MLMPCLGSWRPIGPVQAPTALSDLAGSGASARLSWVTGPPATESRPEVLEPTREALALATTPLEPRRIDGTA